MKNLAVLLMACCLVGKTTAQSKTPGSLRELKNLLESHFSGTAIRDKAVEFELKRDPVSDNYKLTGGIQQLVGSALVETLQQKIDKLYTPTDTTAYTGTVYFDRYTDCAVADVHPLTANRMFYSVPIMLNPTGGMEAFSRRFHDFLRNQKEKELAYADTLADPLKFRFMVERDGSLISLDTGIAKAVFNAFAQQEKRWSPGIMSGRPSRNEVILHVVTEFVRTGQGWPDEYEWVSIRELPRFDIGRQLTYCTLSKASLPPGLVIISAIWDPMSEAYRMPIIHDGTIETAQLLINDVQESFEKGNPIEGITSSNRRIYFYRDK